MKIVYCVNFKKKSLGLIFILTLFISFFSSFLKSNNLPSKLEKDKKGLYIPLSTGLTIRKMVIIPANIDDVWNIWTTTDGVKKFFAPKAKVDLAVGGTYEMYFNPKGKKGEKGSENCIILSFIPGEFLSFTWNAPPKFPKVRKEKTWVALFFHSLKNNQTRISLIHLGWQMGEEWQQALKYFDKAWELVLARLKYCFQNGPIDWKKPYTPSKNNTAN